MQERQGIFTWPGLEVREAKQAAWPTRLRRVIFVWEEELSSFYIRKISYLPFRTPPLVKLAGPARGWSLNELAAVAGGRRPKAIADEFSECIILGTPFHTTPFCSQ